VSGGVNSTSSHVPGAGVAAGVGVAVAVGSAARAVGASSSPSPQPARISTVAASSGKVRSRVIRAEGTGAVALRSASTGSASWNATSTDGVAARPYAAAADHDGCVALERRVPDPVVEALRERVLATRDAQAVRARRTDVVYATAVAAGPG
jgi:hypothetical protein